MSKARDIADLDFNSPDIDGGNIDGATIGASTAAAGSFSQLTVAGTSSGTVDGLIITNTDTTNNGLSIGVDSSENAFIWNGSNTSLNLASGNTLALSLDASQNATFAGTVRSDGGGIIAQGGAGNAYLQVGSDTGSWTWKNYRSTHKLTLEDSDGTGEVLSVATNGEFTFNKNVGIGIAPAEMLDIKSTSGDARIRLDAPTGSDTEIKFYNNGVSQYTIGHDDASDSFVVGGANVDDPFVIVDKEKRVGIATTPNSGWNTATGGRQPIQVGFGSISGRLNDLHTEFTNNAYAVGTGNSPQWAGMTRWAKNQIALGSNGEIIFNSADAASASDHAASPNFNWVERFRIRAGNGGVTFNGDTAEANALNDYEEGSWTPEIKRNGATNGASINVATNTARYIKIGHLVYIKAFINQIADGSSDGSGYWRINGLPYPGTQYAAMLLGYNNTPADGLYVGDAGGNFIMTNGAAPFYGSFGSNKELMISFSYHTNS